MLCKNRLPERPQTLREFERKIDFPLPLFPAVVQAGSGQGAAQQAPCGIHALVQQIGLILLDVDVHRLFGAVGAVHGVPGVAVGGLGLVLLTGHPDRKPGGVQFQPVEGTGQTQLFDLLGEVGKEGTEVYGGQTDGYDGQHGGQQPGTLPLADLAQADAGTQKFNADLSETAENKVLEELRSSGCNVVDVDDKTPWQEACAKVIKDNTSDQAELYQKLLDMKA